MSGVGPMSTTQALSREAGAQNPARTKHLIALRLARAGDIESLYDMLLAYFDAPGCPYPSPIETPAKEWVAEMCGTGTCVVAESDSRVIGSVALEVCGFRWNPDVSHLFGHWLYVKPAYRSGGTARRLLDAAKDISRLNHMNLIMGSIWGHEPELMNRMMRMAGFKLVGSAYLFVPGSTTTPLEN